jgi:hypothetical protein
VMNTQLAGVDFSDEQLEELDTLFYVSCWVFSDKRNGRRIPPRL